MQKLYGFVDDLKLTGVLLVRFSKCVAHSQNEYVLVMQDFRVSHLRTSTLCPLICRSPDLVNSNTSAGNHFVTSLLFRNVLTDIKKLTDPSYADQFLLMTQPHVGNTGII